MSSESSAPKTTRTDGISANSPGPVDGDAGTRAPTKGADTVRRHKEERRAERLRDINLQIADGTLVVRQMTVAQREAASRAAARVAERHQARRKVNPGRDKRDP
jgi:hypothetical protein